MGYAARGESDRRRFSHSGRQSLERRVSSVPFITGILQMGRHRRDFVSCENRNHCTRSENERTVVRKGLKLELDRDSRVKERLTLRHRGRERITNKIGRKLET